MEKNECWWTPENLEKSERECRELSDLDGLEHKYGDFGSYRKVLMTGNISGSMLEFHNDLNPAEKIKAINKLLGGGQFTRILDVGCGMGFTTASLAEFYKGAEVLGVDVSIDAINFANKNHKLAKFSSTVIAPDSKKLGIFDLIFCFEFYPFTRNSDFELQAKFIEYFSSQLSGHGKIIIYQLWDNPTSLSSVIDKVFGRLPNLVYTKKIIPHPKLTRLLPTPLARIANYLLEKIFKKEYSKTILIIQARGD